MTFSVIVPVYNAEKYIKEMLDSVVCQLRNGIETEILLIENGSTDSSGEICDDYASRYPGVHSYHYGSIGAYGARREGIQKASGEWLVFVDADDVLTTDALSCIYGALSSDIDILLYNAGFTNDPGKKKFSFPLNENKVYSGDDKKALYEIMCRNDSLNALWNKCVRTEIARKSIDIDAGFLNHGEDLIQTAAFLDNAGGIKYLDKVLYLYRVNSEGLTGGYHPDQLSDQEHAWECFDGYAKKWFGDEFTAVIDERKALTCSIAVKNIIYSEIPFGEQKNVLRDVMNSDFYHKYALHDLPNWAPEEDVFVHELQMAPNPFNGLIWSGVKSSIKKKVKRILKNGL